ncbi:MAG: UDP-3-O-acylglucosamine N-acyltransferase [Legionellaceae bacterium]
MKFTLVELAEKLGSSYQGDPNCIINGIATLSEAQQGQISFLSNPLYRSQLQTTSASAVILSPKDANLCKVNMILSENPYLDYTKLSHIFDNSPKPAIGVASSAVVSPTAIIHSSASIGANTVIEDNVFIDENVIIGPGCVISTDSMIGKDTRLYPNVTLYHNTKIGERVIIHSGAVIGSDGFGMANHRDEWYKIIQLGSVVIGNDVEIGANTTIDRGALGNTVIHDGVKLDNQIQIGHNVQIGKHTVIAGCTGIAGSTKIGNYCQIGGGTGIAGHLTIVDKVYVTGMSMITNSLLKSGLYSSGTGLQENSLWQKNVIRFRQLNDLVKRIKQLEKRLEKFE